MRFMGLRAISRPLALVSLVTALVLAALPAAMVAGSAHAQPGRAASANPNADLACVSPPANFSAPMPNSSTTGCRCAQEAVLTLAIGKGS